MADATHFFFTLENTTDLSEQKVIGTQTDLPSKKYDITENDHDYKSADYESHEEDNELTIIDIRYVQ